MSGPQTYVNTDALATPTQSKVTPANQTDLQKALTQTPDPVPEAISKSKKATQKTGSTSPRSRINQGQTPKAALSSAAQGGAPQEVFRVQLVKNYAELVKPIESSGIKQADWYRNGEPSKNPDIEGPFKSLPRTIEPFDNEATDVASIRVVNSKNEDLVPPYTKFLLEAVTEGHTERSQIVETFGDFYVFLYGERPPVYTYSGTLINSKNANWVADFSFYYDNYLRGTKCVENGAQLILTYAGTQVVGYMLGTNSSKNAQTLEGVKFNFQLVVTSKKHLGLSKDFASYIQDGQLMEDAKIREILNSIAGPEGQGTATEDASVGSEKAYSAINGGPAAGIIA